jgi:hypothetical protein
MIGKSRRKPRQLPAAFLIVQIDGLGRWRPHVMVNLIGDDKAAHLRGPGHPPRPAQHPPHGRLVKHLRRRPKHSKPVNYDFFVFSHHGMTPAKSVAKDAGKTLQAQLREHFSGRVAATN